MLRWIAIHTIGRLCNVKCCQRSCGSAEVLLPVSSHCGMICPTVQELKVAELSSEIPPRGHALPTIGACSKKVTLLNTL